MLAGCRRPQRVCWQPRVSTASEQKPNSCAQVKLSFSNTPFQKPKTPLLKPSPISDETPCRNPSQISDECSPAGSRLLRTCPGLLLLLSSASCSFLEACAFFSTAGTNRSLLSKLTPNVAWSVMPNFCRAGRDTAPRAGRQVGGAKEQSDAVWEYGWANIRSRAGGCYTFGGHHRHSGTLLLRSHHSGEGISHTITTSLRVRCTHAGTRLAWLAVARHADSP